MVYENKEAKASEGGTTENERKYSVLGSTRKIYEYFRLGSRDKLSAGKDNLSLNVAV
jgi:hypothetical protein